MRTPSRQIRQLLPASTRPLGTLLVSCVMLGGALIGLLTLLIHLWFAHPWWTPVLIVLAIALIAAYLNVSNARFRSRLMALAEERPGESICHFARSFNPRAVDTWVIRAVYETLQDGMADLYPAFPVRATDELKELLFDDEDLNMDVAPEIGRLAVRSLNNAEANPYYGKVRSVADLVMFFNAQPPDLQSAALSR